MEDMYKWKGWLGVNNYTVPGGPMDAAAFHNALRGTPDIRFWKPELVNLLGYSPAAATAVRTREELYALLRSKALFR